MVRWRRCGCVLDNCNTKTLFREPDCRMGHAYICLKPHENELAAHRFFYILKDGGLATKAEHHLVVHSSSSWHLTHKRSDQRPILRDVLSGGDNGNIQNPG